MTVEVDRALRRSMFTLCGNATDSPEWGAQAASLPVSAASRNELVQSSPNRYRYFAPTATRRFSRDTEVIDLGYPRQLKLTAAVRLGTFIFFRIFSTCLLAVERLTPRALAISLSEAPVRR